MTLEHEQNNDALIREITAPGLQPVLLKMDAWSDFSRSLNDALADLEKRFAPPKRVNPGRIGRGHARD